MHARRLLPALLLLFPACASNWRVTSARDDAALKEGAQVVILERGRGSTRERITEIRDEGDDVAVRSVDAAMPYLRPLDTPERAIAYSALVRELGVTDSGARGLVLKPDPTIKGSGGNGRYSRTDAEGWGIEFEPSARLFGGGYEVTRVVLLPPVRHAVLTKVSTPWRLVLIREVVSRDGTIRALDEKTLTNGQDAARFADL